ncbi:PAS domain-containing sensor histidine kinase [Dysgonomonas sp. 25]|uniref:sensor histidine kinase n=1 Tax=Dysgonomonas sp. 25 TaxID=2302933 RepID=UPI0013D34453|nr:PAS domain-containing sensor histidine kinase [Dysgonomonas sp. 25]NDV68825.1 GHKL domain-containing protein [Dysgonomonas sp. 25]
MNRLPTKIAISIGFIVLLAIGAGIALAYHAFWIAVCVLPVIIYLGYGLYRLNMKTTEQFQHFAESIKFSESNISFGSTIKNERYRAYHDSLHKALEKFNTLTQKREAELNFYNNLLNRIDFAVIIADEKQAVKWINKAALDLLGRPKITHIEALKNISDDLFDAFNTLLPKTMKIVRLHREGKSRYLAVTLSTVYVNGSPLKIYSLKDVQPVVEETEQSAWMQLVSVLTHEMMNSLTPIISLSDTFSDVEAEQDPAMMAKAMQTIHRRSEGLLEFISNYKKLTQIPIPRREYVSVKEILEDVLSLLKSQGIEAEYIITSDNIAIYADRGQMEQVLINLIKNASEACADKDKPEIQITAMEDSNNRIIISIADNGQGMSPETTERIFMPFYTTKLNGSGIGLSICRQIIDLHGGTLTVTSQAEKGSTFYIRI